MIKLLEALMELDKKEKYFEDRTNKHIALVQQAIEKIASKEWKEFDVNELRELGKVHDASKFVEPERTPYIELTWNKFKGIKDTDPLTNQATLHHVLNNGHHPEYWLEDKSEANINAEDRDKSDKVIDATRMPPLAIAEMVADWQAMAEELKTNTAREWFNEQKDVRWHFSKEQEDLIDELLRVFEDDRIEQLTDKEVITIRPIKYVGFVLPIGAKGKAIDHDGGLLTVKFDNGKTLEVHPMEVNIVTA